MNPPRATAANRFLNLFTEVRPGEAASSLLLALNIYLILSAYYVLKPVREALILAGGGAEVKSYAAAGQAVLLLFALPLYSALASRVSRRLLINAVTLFFCACLLGFYGLAQLAVPLGVVFFLWVGIFNLMVPAQFWAFANDLYTPEAGKRLFVIVAFGASLGAVSGSYLAGALLGSIGVYELLLVAAAILALSLLVTHWVARREKAWGRHHSREDTTGEVTGGGLGERGGYALVLGNRYLLWIALLMLVLNWVNTTGEYILGRTVVNAALQAAGDSTAGQQAFIGGFYADFFTVVYIVGLLLQLFVVSRVLKYLGARVAIMVLPCIALGGYLLAAVYPILGMLRWVKTAENATDYSLQNTVRQMLFLPTTREEKYKAKQVTDTLFVRAGDVLSALLVFAGTAWLSLSTQGFALANSCLVLVWLVLAFRVGTRYRQLVPADPVGDDRGA